jgi:putative transposase
MKTQLSKPARSKARYTEEYKREALELWRASGRSAAKVAAELGIRPPLLYRWAHLEREPNVSKSESKPGRSIAELEAEIRRALDCRRSNALGCPGRRNRIARLMRLERLFARQRSKYRVATTDSRHGGPIAPNRVRTLVVRRPNQVWATDATCILTGQGWLYLVAVLDVFSRRVIGWAMSQLLDAPLVITALRMALNQRYHLQKLIVHSDRGAQFASVAYRQLLAQYGLTASMSRKANCYDNAFIESFFSSLKYELVYHHRFGTFAQARTAIFDYIETFYNRIRLHSKLAYQSPINFESRRN